MRLALVADIHGNLPALDAVLADLATRRVEAVLNLGDCVSGPLWPRDTLARLRGLGWPTVRGNHDRWVAEGGADLGDTDRFAADDLGEDGRCWLGALPPRIADEAGWLAFHAQPDDDNAYLTEDVVGGRLLPATAPAVAARLGPTPARLIVAAHSHLPTVLRLPDGRWIVNPGSVGCPAYDDPTPPAHVSESLSPAARYAVVTWPDGELDRLTVEMIALPYDHAAASHRAAALDRPDWAFALAHGTVKDGTWKDGTVGHGAVAAAP